MELPFPDDHYEGRRKHDGKSKVGKYGGSGGGNNGAGGGNTNSENNSNSDDSIV